VKAISNNLGKTSQIFRLGSTNLKVGNAGELTVAVCQSVEEENKGVKINVGCPPSI